MPKFLRNLNPIRLLSKPESRLLFRYAWKYKGHLLLGLFLILARQGLFLLAPIFIARILNAAVDGTLAQDYLIWGILFLVASALTRGFDFLRNFFMDFTCERIAFALRCDLFRHLQRVPLSYFDSIPAGSVVSRVMSDSAAAEEFYSSFLIGMIPSFLEIVSAVLALCFIDYRLALLALLALPSGILIIVNYFRKVDQDLKKQRRELAQISAAVNETVQGMDVVSCLNREEYKLRELNQKNDQYCDTRWRVGKIRSVFQWPLFSLANELVLILGLVFYGYGSLVMHWAIPLGSIFVFVRYLESITGSIQGLSFRFEGLQRSFAAINHIYEILSLPQCDVREEKIPALRGKVEYRDVSFSYVPEEQVLRKLNLRLDAGKTIALVGRTGSGKSTVSNLLFGFYPLDAGQIWIDDKKIEDYPIYSLRSQMGIVLQDPFIFHHTLYHNISLENPEITEADALRALETVGADSVLRRVGGNLHTMISAQGREFSQGERQLISFARALAHNPRILVLDEATSSVDTATELRIRRAIEKLSEGRSMIIIAHRLSTIRHADRIYVLDHGEVKEEGRHEELLAMNGIYTEMARQQEMI